MVLKKILLCLCLFATGSFLQAEDLVFSGTPAAGKEFLCTFSLKENISRKMEIRGAKEPPVQLHTTDFVLTGLLKIRENNSKVFLFQFVPDSFIWQDNGKLKQEKSFQKIAIDVAMDAAGILRLCRISPDQHPGADTQNIPAALQSALVQLGRSLRTNANRILGPDVSKKEGDFWTVDDRLITALSKNRSIAVMNKKDWDSKVLYTRKEKFFDLLTNRIDINLFTNQIPGYDCRINMTYLFPVDDAKNTGAVSYVLDWMECVDKIMPEQNPIFSGTKIIEIKTMTIRRDLMPVK